MTRCSKLEGDVVDTLMLLRDIDARRPIHKEACWIGLRDGCTQLAMKAVAHRHMYNIVRGYLESTRSSAHQIPQSKCATHMLTDHVSDHITDMLTDDISSRNTHPNMLSSRSTIPSELTMH